MKENSLPLFRIITTSLLVLLIGFIILLFIADIGYVTKEAMLEVIQSEEIRYAFNMSLATSLITTLIAVLLAIPIGYALSRFPFKGIIIFDIIVDLLIVLPVIVTGVSLLVFFRMGNQLSESPIGIVRLFGNLVATMGDAFIYKKAGIVLAQFCCSVSFSIR